MIQQFCPLPPAPLLDGAKLNLWTPPAPPSMRQSIARGWRELGVQSWRIGLGMLRSPELALMHCVVAAVLGVVVGAVYYQSGLDKEGERLQTYRHDSSAVSRVAGLLFNSYVGRFRKLQVVSRFRQFRWNNHLLVLPFVINNHRGCFAEFRLFGL